MSRAEICALVALAGSSNPAMQAKDPRPIVEAWSLMLGDLDPVLAKAAIIKVCRESDFFPSVARIVAAARELDPGNEKLPTAAEAWEEVMRLVSDYGPYRCPVYSCEAVRRAVRAIGWRQLCVGENIEADRAHFLRLYESMRGRQAETRELEQVMKLAGVGELLRALAEKTQGGKQDESKSNARTNFSLQ